MTLISLSALFRCECRISVWSLCSCCQPRERLWKLSDWRRAGKSPGFGEILPHSTRPLNPYINHFREQGLTVYIHPTVQWIKDICYYFNYWALYGFRHHIHVPCCPTCFRDLRVVDAREITQHNGAVNSLKDRTCALRLGISSSAEG